MRIPSSVHASQPWRIHEITADFTLEDVWALPMHGGPEDFEVAIRGLVTADFTEGQSLPSRVLWAARDLLGRWFGLGRITASADDPWLPIPGSTQTSLSQRLPADLRNTTDGLRFGSSPFVPLFRTDDELAAEISNRTVHGVLHLAWALQDDGRHQGQLAIYVKPRGTVGRAYMALINPFRHLVIYPAMMPQIERKWAQLTH